jgi:thioesterase domain-containing protein/acyl carrier protein
MSINQSAPDSFLVEKRYSVATDGDALAIIEAVKAAWEASLPSVPFDLEKTWSDLGIDSLKALEFVLRLERALDVRVGFDVMTPECTPSDLARLLAHNAPSHGTVGLRARVFLIPGIGGDEPRLAQFRKALHREVSFETLELPDIGCSMTLVTDIAATADRLAEQIISLQPGDAILLAGYSYGGIVAQEIARQLEVRGRRVAYLALLDGQLSPTRRAENPTKYAHRSIATVTIGQVMAITRALGKTKHRFKSAINTSENWRSFSDRLIFYLLSRMNALERARLFLLNAEQRHDWIWTADRRRWLLTRARSWAVMRWRPNVSDVPALLLVSNDRASNASVKGWQRACPHLRIVPVHSEHEQIFESQPMAIIVPAFLEELAAARRDTRVTA